MTQSKKILFGLLVLLVITFVAYRWYDFFSAEEIRQPLQFNHRVHTEMIQCEDCHGGVKKSASATLPGLSVCMGCHGDKPLTDRPEEKKLLQYISQNQEIRWQRIFRNPVHVYFSHARHVAVGQLECEKCHGEMGKRTRPPGQALVNLTMDDCISCHKQKKIDTSCVICHK